MSDHHRKPLALEAAEKWHVLRARRLIGDIAGQVPDSGRARRLEADLNDAWLRLQLALVADDPVVAQAQRQACERLVSTALRGAGPKRGPGKG